MNFFKLKSGKVWKLDEKVAVYKYLGIDVFNTIFKTGAEKQKKAIAMANKYKFGCISNCYIKIHAYLIDNLLSYEYPCCKKRTKPKQVIVSFDIIVSEYFEINSKASFLHHL